MDFGSSYILREDDKADDPSVYQEEDTEYESEVMAFNQPQVNTNTVQLEMKKLEELPDVKVEMSKYVECQNASCGAVYSHLAKLDLGTINLDKEVWICNFCDHKNEFYGEELPDLSNNSDVMYAKVPSSRLELQPPESSKQKIIFVIDTSASMSQNIPVKVSEASAVLKEIFYRELENQARKWQIQVSDLPQTTQDPDIINVTWLQATKASLIEAIDSLSQSDRRDTLVGLVTFNDLVTVYGDGMKRAAACIDGDHLTDLYNLQTKGEESAVLKPIRESGNSLKDKISILDEQGLTALGPALLIAQGMCHDAPGSKIILCTDGVANIGLGKLEDTTVNEINEFYSTVIKRSRLIGVSISIICFDKAGLNTKLGEVPIETGGMLEVCQVTEFGMKLTEEFRRATVAINTTVKFVVHKNMYVENAQEPFFQSSQCTKTIGNLLLDRQIPFSFAFKPSNPQQGGVPSGPVEGEAPSKSIEAGASSKSVEAGASSNPVEGGAPSKMPTSVNEDTQTEDLLLPFQVQIEYQSLSRANKVKRVWTVERKMTTNRAQAENAMSMKTIAENFIQEVSHKLLSENRESKGNISELVFEYLPTGNLYKTKLQSPDEDTKDKLSRFLALLTTIVRQRYIKEDQIAELNTLQEARKN